MSTDINIHAFLDSDSETFTYVVSDKASNKGVIIDSVLDFDPKSGRTSTKSAEEVVAYVKSSGIEIEWILETHAHADHLSAAPFLKEQVGGKIAIGESIQTVQKTFKEVFNLENEFLPNGSQFDQLLKEGDELKVGDLSIQVMHTPGHTPADLTYLINNKHAFVGDTIFAPDVGTARCDFPGGDAETLYDSIQRLLSLPEETNIYLCHDYPTKGREHEYKTSVKAQKLNNIHVKQGNDKAMFVKMRTERDATLAMPRLILPAVQINIRAGQLPPKDDNGVRYLKLPLNAL